MLLKSKDKKVWCPTPPLPTPPPTPVFIILCTDGDGASTSPTLPQSSKFKRVNETIINP